MGIMKSCKNYQMELILQFPFYPSQHYGQNTEEDLWEDND